MVLLLNSFLNAPLPSQCLTILFAFLLVVLIYLLKKA